MNKQGINKILNILFAIVWLVNGLFCKVLNLVPRHEEIVSKILHLDNHSANILTILIGIGELLMAVWIISRIKQRLNAIAQIIIIMVMNTLELFLVPEMLLWGKLNFLFAFLFILLICFNEFVLNTKNRNA